MDREYVDTGELPYRFESTQSDSSFSEHNDLCAICSEQILLELDSFLPVRPFGTHYKEWTVQVNHIVVHKDVCKWCRLLAQFLRPSASEMSYRCWYEHRTYLEVNKAGGTWDSVRYARMFDIFATASQMNKYVGRIAAFVSDDDLSLFTPIMVDTDTKTIINTPTTVAHNVEIPSQGGWVDFSALNQVVHGCKLRGCPQLTNKAARLNKPVDLTLIDVKNMCLVDAMFSEEYVCLSYVWGSSCSFKATSRDRKELRQVDSLRRVQVANLIQDVIVIVQKLQVRYLWVDQLCIEQDNAADQHAQIGQMDLIYGNSLFTIVAWSVTSASDHITGLHIPHNAKVNESPVKINSWIMRPHVPWTDYSWASPAYTSRGWTLQEQWLSPRCLYLEDFAVHYHCHACHDDKSLSSLPCQPSVAFWNHTGLSGHPADLAYQRYQHTVGQYTQRDLTMPTDKLFAFSGLYAAMGEEYLGSFVCGLPGSFLMKALIWTASTTEVLRRNSYFSSWSWAGWIGRVHYLFREFTSTVTSVALSTISLPGTHKRCLNPFSAANSGYIDSLSFTSEVLYHDTLTFQTSQLPPNKMWASGLELEFVVTCPKTGSCQSTRVGQVCMTLDSLRAARNHLFGDTGPRKELLVKLGEGSKYKGSTKCILALLVGCPTEGNAERLALCMIKPRFWNELFKDKIKIQTTELA